MHDENIDLVLPAFDGYFELHITARSRPDFYRRQDMDGYGFHFV
jgi:hypothetical protein